MVERKILLAEDSATQAERVRLLLEGEGYRVDVVGNGREGLANVQSALPDLIISDIVMPDVDGYAFCRAVKSAEQTRRIPFVLLTERNTPADFIKGLQQGADNFITKPFEDDYLLERVQRIFENLELRRSGHLDVEVTLSAGGQQIVINADKQQMIELLFATLEDLVRMNGRLVETQRIIEEHAKHLEAKVQERTQQLLQTEKLATMGQLLAGVAHELNNPLSVVVGQTLLLRESPGSGPAERAEKIAKAAERCVRVVKNFLALARQHPPERMEASLNRVVQEAVELLAYQLRVGGIEVTLDLANELPLLWADPHQLHQVVVNLITNALDSMRGGPAPRRLTFMTRAESTRARVVLEVTDTGPGVPLETRQRIFEPFFTTKAEGQGTGLGLSLCKEIIDGHGGSIGVEGGPDQGAVFRVELPVQALSTSENEARAAMGAPPIRGKTILVVDDEPEIAGVLRDLLSVDGHQVETALNGEIALQKLGERRYDLILSDVRMPGLDGPGLYRELERRYPNLVPRFIFVTGDALGPETRRFVDGSGILAVSKPFDLEAVRRTVQRALSSSAGG